MFRVIATNECKSPRWSGNQIELPVIATRAQAEKLAASYNRHIAEYNRAMQQNVRYAVVED